MTQSDTFFIRFRGRTTGPVSREDLARMVRRGQVTRMHQVSMDQSEWRRGSDVSEWLGEDGEILTRDATSAALLQSSADTDIAQQSQDLLDSVVGTQEHEAVPAAVKPVHDSRWFVEVRGEQIGPLADSEILSMYSLGSIAPSTIVWREGYSNWMTFDSTELAALTNQQAVSNRQKASEHENLINKVYCEDCGQIISANALACPHCGATRASGRTGDAQAKTKISAALLAGFLGGIGIHKFYYGSWGWGLMYILFCVTGIPLILSVIDFIVLLCMSEKQFDNKYNKQPPSPFKW